MYKFTRVYNLLTLTDFLQADSLEVQRNGSNDRGYQIVFVDKTQFEGTFISIVVRTIGEIHPKATQGTK